MKCGDEWPISRECLRKNRPVYTIDRGVENHIRYIKDKNIGRDLCERENEQFTRE